VLGLLEDNDAEAAMRQRAEAEVRRSRPAVDIKAGLSKIEMRRLADQAARDWPMRRAGQSSEEPSEQEEAPDCESACIPALE
jgi:hypothetical protein